MSKESSGKRIEKSWTRMSKLERLLETLRLLAKQQLSMNNTENGSAICCKSFSEFRRDIDFLLEQNVIKENMVGKRKSFELTPKGARILNYFNLMPQEVDYLYSQSANPHDSSFAFIGSKSPLIMIKDIES